MLGIYAHEWHWHNGITSIFITIKANQTTINGARLGWWMDLTRMLDE